MSPLRALAASAALSLFLLATSASASSSLRIYDTDWGGTGSLITHVAVTLRDAVAGQPRTVDVDFPATAYDIPSGHRLSLVIDTVDPLYADKAPLFSLLKLSSSSSSPSYVSLPLK